MRNDISSVHPQVHAALRRKKAALTRLRREFRIRQPRQIDPRNIERKYRMQIVQRAKALVELIAQQLIPNLESLLKSNAQTLGRRDALADDIYVIINGIRIQFARLWQDGNLRERIRETGLDVSTHNAAQLNKVAKAALGIDLFRSEPWLRDQVENFVEQNVALIKSVDERYFGEVQEIVFRGARTGASTKDIAQEIRERGQVSLSRAELIARDQVNKLNGNLSEIRQRDLGVESYRWRTSLDERVREEHAAREGKVFSWSEPPSDGHPGEPINCRCYAEPVLEELIGE